MYVKAQQVGVIWTYRADQKPLICILEHTANFINCTELPKTIM